MDVADEKRALRKKMSQLRNSISPAEKRAYDKWICTELKKIIFERKCKVVHAYLPLRGEINIRPLLEKLLAAKIKVVCPKTLPRPKLENRVLKSFEALETGVMKTQYPADADVYEGPFDLIIVPGLAIDRTNFRLGYGGGYYDHFLAQHPEAYKVGIYYPVQLLDSVPVEPHDVQLDSYLMNHDLFSQG